MHAFRVAIRENVMVVLLVVVVKPRLPGWDYFVSIPVGRRLAIMPPNALAPVPLCGLSMYDVCTIFGFVGPPHFSP